MFGKKKAPDKLPSLGIDRIRSSPIQQAHPQEFRSHEQVQNAQPHQMQNAQAHQMQNSQSHQMQQHNQMPQHDQPQITPQQNHQLEAPMSNHTQLPPAPQVQSQPPLQAQVIKPQPKYDPLPSQKAQEHAPQVHQQISTQEFEQMQNSINQQQQSMLQKMKTASPEAEEQGYFKELIKSVTEDNGDVEKLTSWYEDKFLPSDLVFQMREYWEKQQPDILLKNIRGDLKQELLQKTDRLHQLEAEWQEVYFNLLSKEEEIRKEEGNLKDSLSQFMNLFKESLKNRKDRK